MIAKFCLCAAVAITAFAQQTAPAANASISGVVKDKATGKPLADYIVSTFTNSTWVGDTIFQSAGTKEVQATTDSSGRYRLTDLAPALYRIEAGESKRFGGRTERRIKLSGHDLENIDFQIVVAATISGKVVDDNNEPMPGMAVRLISREYFLGSIGYFFRSQATTDDRGEYVLPQVPAGSPVRIMVEKNARNTSPHSEVPLDPRLRRAVPARTWFPKSPIAETAETLVLRPGERREAVNIEVKKFPSYCIDGVAEGPNGPAEIQLNLIVLNPAAGLSNGMSQIGFPGGPPTGPDGKFRFCDLTPGNYRLTALQGSPYSNAQQSPNFGILPLVVTDQDQHGLKLIASAPSSVDAEIAWAAEPPATPSTARVFVSLAPLLRGNLPKEGAGVRPEIPGVFTVTGLFPDDYSLRTTLRAPGIYIKDVTLSGRSIRNEPFRPASAPRGASLRILVGHDGGTLNVLVRDKYGNPVGDLPVLIIPADVSSEAVLAESVARGVTDQQGQFSSATLAPGKYFAVATDFAVDYTPETVHKLWAARNRFQEVTLPPSGSPQVNLTPVKID